MFESMSVSMEYVYVVCMYIVLLVYDIWYMVYGICACIIYVSLRLCGCSTWYLKIVNYHSMNIKESATSQNQVFDCYSVPEELHMRLS